MQWLDKIVIIKDGSIQGWFASFIFTIFTMVMLCLGFFVSKVADGWVKFGGTFATIYLGSIGIWLGYKVVKKKVENSSINMDNVLSAFTKVMKKPEDKPLEKQ